MPIAVNRNCASPARRFPESRSRVLALVPMRAHLTVLRNCMSRRRSNLSATWFRYSSVSGCGEKCSFQSHSCSSSLEKE